MELKQILILALCVDWISTARSRCNNETELEAMAVKRLSKCAPPPHESLALEDAPVSCPVDLYQWTTYSLNDNERSISPWKFVKVTQPDYYPKSYSKAKCLCSGCIMRLPNGTVTESFDYNSKPILQNFRLLRRVKCKEGEYRLEPEDVKLPVGCTCVRTNAVQT